MSVSDSFKGFVLEELARVATGVRARRMFGGVGIYSDELFFALIDDDVLYLKTDASTRADFEALGMPPFRPTGDAGETMGYHQVPPDVLENPDALARWVNTALSVARQARARRSRRRD